jgi:two-component system response regulator HydG
MDNTTLYAPEKSSVLIVDDELSIRNTFRIFLQRAGYGQVETAASCDEALEVVSKRDFDLIFCDIVLESCSGIDLLKILRERGVDCPVVIVTGYPHVETASEAVRLGAFDYLAKPVEKEPLLKIARLAMSHYQMEKRNRQAEIEQKQARDFLETVFSSVSDAIIAVTENQHVQKFNTAAAELFALLPGANEQTIRLTDIGSQKGLMTLVQLTQGVIDSQNKITDHRLEYTRDGRNLLLSVCISPLSLSKQGHISNGAVIVLRDITYKLAYYPEGETSFHTMLGCSPAIREIFMLIKNIGRVDTSVLITGPSGTGKELAAHALHLESPRSKQPFVKVACTAIPDNLLESELFGHKKGAFTGATEDRMGRIVTARGGTLFLDEIGDISTMMQLRLLRFLQEKSFYPVGRDKEIHVDVRVIAATNADLREKVKTGSFREDLYYRLLIIELALPPLKDRHGDVRLLTNHFIRHFSASLKKPISAISEEAMAQLCQYHWPGNVRQLEHIIERAIILCEESTLSLPHLPVEITSQSARPQQGHLPARKTPDFPSSSIADPPTITSAETIIEALRKTGGNKAKAARLLKIDRSTLYRKIHELAIDTQMFSF